MAISREAVTEIARQAAEKAVKSPQGCACGLAAWRVRSTIEGLDYKIRHKEVPTPLTDLSEHLDSMEEQCVIDLGTPRQELRHIDNHILAKDWDKAQASLESLKNSIPVCLEECAADPPGVVLRGVGGRPPRPEQLVESREEKIERRRRGLKPGTPLELVSPEEHDRIIESYDRLRSLGYGHTESMKMVADRLNRAVTTVLSHVLRGRPPKRRAITPERLEEITNLRRQGLSKAEIARRLGLTREYVGYLLHKAGEKVNVAEHAEELHKRMMEIAERLSTPDNIPQLKESAEKLYQVADDAALLLEITRKIPLLPEYFPSHPYQLGFRSILAAEVLETGVWCLEEKEKSYSMREYLVDGWKERPSPHTPEEKKLLRSCGESAREAAVGYLQNKPGYESKMAQHMAIVEELVEETE